VVYFVSLLASAPLTIASLDWTGARDALSFNLSGPISIFISLWFFSDRPLNLSQMRRLLLLMAAPVTGVATLAVSSTLAMEDLRFTLESNFAASGGFGPNQVSAVLGLGAWVLLLLVLERGLPSSMRLALIALAIVFLGQGMVTFSRGGVYLALACCAVTLYLAWRRPSGQGGRIALKLVVAAALLGVLVYPRLMGLTGVLLSERFLSLSTTRRDVLARTDLELWLQHPVFGVGPGMAPELKEGEAAGLAAHTEFTRVLAEHGIFGIISIASLLVTLWRRRPRKGAWVAKMVWAASAMWAMLYLSVNAVRLFAPAFMLGLACSRISPRTDTAADLGGSASGKQRTTSVDAI